ncbi:hypothetical protein [Lewinella sp. IMCC34191]|uniref:hypothetical protein n=1 Tax=Lewinella sp. IMCC34191 TaxID=2259172 RepID=UPI000E257B42|nr:hypothetical protein [Lewinella sp. IMCC34191]
MHSYLLPALLCLSLFLMEGCDDSAPDSVSDVPREAAVDTMPPTPAQTLPPDDLVTDEAGGDTESGPIEKIRTRYREVQQLLDAGSLRTDTLTVLCQVADGEFFMVRYLDGEEVVMLRTTTGIGHAFTTKRMYFQDGELFFAWWIDEQFSPVSPLEGAGEEMGWVSEYEETRYYIVAGEVIRQLTKSYETESWNDDQDPAAVPNQSVEVAPGTPYPEAEQLAEWKTGEVNC